LENIDPRVPPTTAWTGEQLRKIFRTLKSHFAKVDEAGADVEEVDRFMGHGGRLLPEESDDVHNIMLFAFWAFDKHPPQFITHAKPQHQ
jgi:hypothetical protein